VAGLSRRSVLAIAGIAIATVIAGILRYASGISPVLAFIVAAIALAGLAWIVSFATEQVGRSFGPAVTGVMQSTLGNLPEFFVVIFALNAGQLVVAETAILGSILVNALLVLGLVIIAGAWKAKDGVMRFGRRLPNDTATLLLVSSFIIVLLGVAHSSHDAVARHTKTISIIGAIALLLVYAVWLREYLRSDRRPDEKGEGERDGTPGVPIVVSIILLSVAGVASAFVSDWFVHALQPTIDQLHISEAFAGLVIVAIAGNAVENVAGIVLALKGESELAISVVKNSVAQIAAFLYPLLVLVSLLTATTLTFSLAPVYIAALLGTAIIVWQITGDGEAGTFEGTALIAAYVILATVAAFE
jgi:Ca2+:H+ antiporter